MWRCIVDSEDWDRFEELVYQAGGVLNDLHRDLPDGVRADAMSFHTLGLAILDISNRIGRLEASANKPERSTIIVPNGY